MLPEFLRQLFDLFGLSFLVFKNLVNAFRDVGAGDGKRASDGVEERVVAAGGADGAEAADELDAPALADLFDTAQEDGSDGAGSLRRGCRRRR